MKDLIRFAALAAMGIAFAFQSEDAAAGTARAEPAVAQAANVHLPFIANEGQVDARVAFYARTFAGTVFATRAGELIYSLPAPRSSLSRTGTGWLLKESFVDGAAAPSAGERFGSNISVLTAARQLPNVAAVNSVRFGEVWPGIEVAVHARPDNIEKIFTLAPGIGADAINLKIEGATLALAADGSLVAITGNGPLSFAAPIAYQDGPRGRDAVKVSYRLADNRYGFALGDFDRTRAVVIDPIIQSTYIGGAGTTFLQEGPRDIAVHPASGDVYVAGATDSMDLPGVTAGAVPAMVGTSTGFIARFSADLTTLQQATFFGGEDGDWVSSITVTASDVYVSGYTAAATLPAGTTAGAQPTDPNPGTDFNGFIARLPLSLTAVTASTFVGGTTNQATRIFDSLLHGNGDLYVCGQTASGSLPTVTGGFDAVNAPGNRTAFVARIASDLTTFQQLTYFGDGGLSGGTQCNSMITVPASGEVVIGGHTEFGSFPPPNTTGGLLATTTGSWLARLDEALTQNPQSTWLAGVAPGSGDPEVYGLRRHPVNGDLYALTRAKSDSPLPANAALGGGQPDCSGAFPCLLLMRITPQLTSLVAGTFYGNPVSSTIPRAFDHLTFDPVSGDAFIASDGANALPDTAGGIQPAPVNSAGTPGMIVRIRGDLGQIIQATYLSGAGTSGTSPYAAIVHPNGHLYVAGYTGSPSFPLTSGGAQAALGGTNGDGFVSRITLDLLAAAASPGIVQFSPSTYTTAEGATTVQISVTRTGGSDGAASVTYATGGGTATAGVDYSSTSGTLSWASDDGATKIISVPVLSDTTVESTETIGLALTNATGAALGTQTTAILSITDDDVAPTPQPGVVQFAAASYSGNENGGSVTLTLTRTTGADGAISVSVASGGGSASSGSDYTALTQTVNWAAGDAVAKTVTLAILNDTADEPDESVTVTLSNPGGGATLGAVPATTVTIVDDDVTVMPPPAASTETKGSYGGGALEWYSLLLLGSLLLRRRIWAALMCVVAGVSVANATETVAGPYVGVRGGVSESTLEAGAVEQRLASAGFTMDVSIDDRDRSWSVFGGYRWANGLRVEASYVDLGEFDVSMAGTNGDPEGLLPAAVDALADAGQGGAVTLGWQWTLTDSFAITPRIGMYYWESEREVGNASGTLRAEDSATEITGGLALTWRFASHWAIGLNWDAYDAGDHQDVHAWTASLEYAFGP